MHDSSEPLASGALPTHLPTTALDELQVLPIIEERVVITRETVESGRVRLIKEVYEHNEVVNLMLQHDELDVEHVAVNQLLADGAALPTSRHEGDTLIVPVLREVVVTRVLLVEEIRVTKRQVTAPHTQTVPLRREQVRVERYSAPDLPPTN